MSTRIFIRFFLPLVFNSFLKISEVGLNVSWKINIVFRLTSPGKTVRFTQIFVNYVVSKYQHFLFLYQWAILTNFNVSLDIYDVWRSSLSFQHKFEKWYLQSNSMEWRNKQTIDQIHKIKRLLDNKHLGFTKKKLRYCDLSILQN